MRAIVNPGFESGPMPTLPPSGIGVAIVNQTSVAGWRTSASDGMIEIWHRQNNQGAIPPYEGNFFAEMNANTAAALYQLICFTNNEPLRWRFAHRYRSGGPNPQTALYEIAAANNSDSRVQLLATQSSSSATVWNVNQNMTGTVRFTGVSGIYRLQFRTTNTGSYGNFLDDVQIFLSPYVEFAASLPPVSEGSSASHANLQGIVVDGTVTSPLSIPIRVTGGTATIGVDYATPNGSNEYSISIPAGTYAATRFPLGLSIANDALVEGNETITLELLADPTNTYTRASTISCGAASLTQATITIAGTPADLEIVKTVDKSAVLAGESVVFSLTARNLGGLTSAAASVADLLPSGYAYLSASSPNYNGATGVWSIGTLAPGAAATLQITARTNAGGSHVNTATISSSPADANAANNVSTASVAVSARADLRVTKTASETSPLMGRPMTFTVTARNASVLDLHQVTVRDLPPAGYQLVSATPSLGSYAAATGLWTIPQLNAGQSATLLVAAVPLSVGPWTNVAELISMRSWDGVALQGVGATPGNGVVGEPDQDQATPTPIRGSAPAVAAVCSAASGSLDWGAAGWTDGATSRPLALAKTTGLATLVSGAASAGWPRVRAVGAEGAAALEIQGAGEAQMRLAFDAPLENLRLELRGLGANADGLERLRVSAWLKGVQVPAQIAANGASVSLVGGAAVGVGAPGAAAGALWVEVDVPADEIRFTLDSLYGSAGAVWSAVLGAATACEPSADLQLSPNHESTVLPGGMAIYPHRLFVSPAFDAAALRFEIESDQGLLWSLHHDDGDGLFDGAKDPLWTNGAPVAAGERSFWLAARLPTNPPVGWRDRTVLRALATRGLLSASREVVDATWTGDAGDGSIHAVKRVALDADCDGAPDLGEAGFAVDGVQIGVGQCAIYQIAFENRGVEPVSAVRVRDSTPNWTQYRGGSAVALSTPAGLSDPTISHPDADASGDLVFAFEGALAPGRSGLVTFSVRLH